MFALFQSAGKARRLEKIREIATALAGRWALDSSFSLPGEGPANLLVETLNQMLARLHTFVVDLTRRNVETAAAASLTHA